MSVVSTWRDAAGAWRMAAAQGRAIATLAPMSTVAAFARSAVIAAELTVMLAPPCVADSPSSNSIRMLDLHKTAWKLAPRPPAGPLRGVNIGDIEVREIQAAAASVLPRAIVNIGGVATGCPCEDGAECTDQVWVVASTPTTTRGLLFSRLNGRWDVGPVQKWWLDYQDLASRRTTFPKLSEYLTAERELLDRLPACASER